MCEAGGGEDATVGDGSVVDRACGGDDVFVGVTAVAGVASGPGVGGGVMLHGFDIAGRDLVEAQRAPGVEHAGPVAAVGSMRAGTGGRDDTREIFGEGGDAVCQDVVILQV